MNKFLRVASTAVIGGVMLMFGAGSMDLYDDYESPGVNTDYTSYITYPIPSGHLDSQIVSIEAVDGSFSLNGGESFNTPFSSSLWPSDCPYNLRNGKVLDMAREAKACGAKDVIVRVSGKTKPLYGVLALNPRIQSSFGPSSQSYFIKVRSDKIQSAYSGNTSVSFEIVKYKKTTGYSNRSSRQQQELNNYGWVLWLSAFPL